ncbi:alpha-L-fucosidase [Mangrovibacterium lignilyticum]|uniref:alpha-L-fucosidase n=1 Tax=Mangrovibacterium lignilyticum TaxID=2668052 RepID=UPI0013D87FB3|nr:alpha-L-fucosidase [Mangrovibacterium lignilyticum]
MKKIIRYSFSILLVALAISSCQTKVPAPAAIGPVPDARQMAWHEMEMNAFIHFTINTYTDKEWGFGDESPALFNPTNFDAEQWVSVLKDAGFKGVILTCKHHDGFCLWPSEYTDHDIAESPFEDGKGDIVKAVSDACHKFGLKFGVYMSPWDRNRADYGEASYVEYYRNQLKELFNNYGPVFEMWFDGANGGDGYYGGANEMRKIERQTYYDWPTTLKMVHEIQPEVLFFSDGGPDLRWVGNEQGHVNATNWNTITTDTLYAGKSGIEDLLGTGSIDGKEWCPAEVNTSIRPGWFYHQSEDDKVKSPEVLFKLYMESVGRGSTMLLNIPPDRRGLFHENDVASLQGFHKLIEERFGNDLAKGASATASETRGDAAEYAAANLVDGNKNTYWATNDATTAASLEIDLGDAKEIHFVQLEEYIQLGQRVKTFKVEAFENGQWKEIANGTTIGYRRILQVDPITTSKVKITIEDSKACPVVSTVSLF